MPKFERIKFKPIPVRDLLLELKNLSELMVDLAYSAALFNDAELAEDVLALENRIDTLEYLLEMEMMIAAQGNPKDAETLIGVAKVAEATDKISDAAADIAAIVTRKIGVHPIVGAVFEKVEKRVSKILVQKNSPLVDMQIEMLDLQAKAGIDIIAVRRNKTWIIDPKKWGHLMAGDILIIRGPSSRIKDFKVMAEGRNGGTLV
jgi:uncharacterized protein with PhoU and TrkA domain